MKFAYSTKITDNGSIIFGGVIPVPDSSTSTTNSYARFDVYVDVFDTCKEAEASLKARRGEAYGDRL